MHASREHRGEARVIYWFRTPPNVRVGRAALDEEAIRTIEETHPRLSFDWTRMLKARPPEVPAVDTRDGRDRRGRESRGRRGRRRGEAPALPPTPPATAAEPALAVAGREVGGVRAELPGPSEEAEGPHPALPPGLHVEERLGHEGFSRLRARYAELLARISERVSDPAKLEELRAQAERLNPETWITDDEARAGIEGFDAAYETIRARLGRRRRSRRGGARRRRKPGGSTPAESGPADAPSAGPEVEGGVGPAEPDDAEPE